ncbi:hypothetical protein [Aureibacter tunicatorum]|uniref:Uncharacterized protein n=1 Tax=Aureibacter tunicatorum TaxID=866807 RepID=A0AAE3XT33_9BACT|nr:hypothetical protein [Aureibacter tunicatorum]MDR6241129.1 hypothetical protein [Aureibacter tunicatorum]BDD03907.1 hypothetical protein AUTU_13900 [Aureibacter tunicatorum]
MFEEIGVNIIVEKEKINGILNDCFSDLNIHYFDQETTWEMSDKDNLNENSIYFSFIKNESEFPLKIEIGRTPSENGIEREQFIAKIISDKLNCKTIASYKPPKADDDYPSDSIIFHDGKAFFGNDSNTMWADGEGGKVIEEYEINYIQHRFDKKAKIKQIRN